MAGDVVFMDVLPSLSGFAKELATGTHKAATDTGKTAGGAWSKAFSQTAGDSGSDAVVAELAANEEKAKRAVQSATTEIGKARAAQREAAARVIDQEAKYQAAVEKSKAAADGTAEQQAQAQAKVEAASLRLEAAREKERIAAGKVDGAESGLRAAYRESEEAAKQLAAATDEAAKAAAEGGKEAKESESKWGGVGSAIGALPGKVKDFAGSLGGVVTAAAGAVGAAAAFSEGWEQALDLSTGTAKVEAALGLTEQQSAAAGEAAGTLYADNYGESMDDVTGAVESVMSSFAGMRDASTADLEKVTGQAMSVAKAFDVDVDEAVAASAQLINQGLAGDATEAFDLMTASLQKVPKALRGEVMDATGEYSQFFSQLGIDGPEAMGLLAAASEDGQYGIDKMGDALKELTIRSSDMSTTSVAAYEAAGLSAEDMSAKFLAGGDTARGAFDELIAGLQGIEDPTERANAAIGLFGTPLEDLSTSDIPDFLDSLSSMDSSLGDVAGTAAQLDETMGDAVDPVESVKRSFVGILTEAILPLVEPLQSVAEWAKENPGLMQGVAVAVGVLATAWGIYTAAQWAANSAMLASPITWIVVGIAAVAAGVVALVKNWDTVVKWLKDTWEPIGDWFVGIWETVSDAAVAAWEWIGDSLETSWEWINENVFEPVKEGVQWVADKFVEAKDWVVGAWGAMGDGLAAGWQWTKDNVFTPIGDAAQWVVDKFIQAKDWVVDTWTAMGDGLTSGWQLVKDNVFTPITDGAQSIWDKFVAMKDGAISAWDSLTTRLLDIWSNLKTNLFEPVVLAAQSIWDKFVAMKDGSISVWIFLKDTLKIIYDQLNLLVFQPVINVAQGILDKFVFVKDGVVGAWNLMKDGLKSGWDWINTNIFSKMKEGVAKVGDAFDTAQEAIGTAWNQIKEKTREPVNFVIQTVYNDGVRSAFNTIADKVGLPSKWRLPHVQKVATGGVLPGYTPGVDVHKFYSDTAGILELSGGEAIMRPEFTRAVGGKAGVAALNKAAIAGTMPLAKYAGGGVFDTLGGWVSSAWNWTKDAAETTWNFLSNPVEGFKQLVLSPMNTLLGGIGGSTWDEIAKGIPKMVIGGVVDAAVSAVKNIFDASSGGSAAAVGGPILAGGWALPSRGPITSGYGPRWGSFHAGTDIAGGGPTFAAHAGRVTRAGWNPIAGRTGIGILLDHGGGIQTYYGHNPVGGVRVAPGQMVKAGQHIGYQGATGNVTGTHLHFEVHRGNPNAITNPVPFMASKGIRLGTYDVGGTLDPGLTLAFNGTGKPETIRTHEQEQALGGDIDLSPETIRKLSQAIGEELGLVGETVRDHKRAVTMARTLERTQ